MNADTGLILIFIGLMACIDIRLAGGCVALCGLFLVLMN